MRNKHVNEMTLEQQLGMMALRSMAHVLLNYGIDFTEETTATEFCIIKRIKINPGLYFYGEIDYIQFNLYPHDETKIYFVDYNEGFSEEDCHRGFDILLEMCEEYYTEE